ncbi:alcohol dehydrogenase zinc-binding domain protein [Conidiobolus coronatus NRRL 28638]|uniref:Probable quinone oxidoreductase n=1 Tax=Conidiobolus coronatus (strain ATCC 28846 / CBS 209.66 / NRRL 28638) TaxID=796925 RepID=A0A137P0L9_CONC2|nr:alcohol dehydrogenase zinc-binding domain protein [Conidiobolus coronatus NRRL 28638]|eukprot:KXN68518.1 alcohol dehydrogenase zinc-binding domain protein [Conidiobolus coronatus NRRL 28638]
MSTNKTVIYTDHGDINVVKYTETPKPTPGPNQVIVKNKSVGVNFIDYEHRVGKWPSPVFGLLGIEGAGIIDSIGTEVQGLSIGDPKIPDSISFETAAALFVQGITAITMVKGSWETKKGDTILIYSAAGGTGQLLVKLANYLGATVIGVTSSEAKVEAAKKLGAHHVINYNTEDIATRVLEITNGKGVDVVFDCVGKSTFDASLKSLKKFGTFISFGSAGGKLPPIDINILAPKNIKIVKTSLFTFLETLEEVEYWTGELFDLYEKGVIPKDIYKIYPLSEAKQALVDLESGKTTGKLLLAI